ncbi:hypothetical protein F4825DRAFT_435753 [Nemania diffusa]|nr:hypothetical protein F4825DRAFT_435753 [Nemania diffusa]
MSFTLMPFLYQTRTILRIPPHRASRASAAIVRSLHTTARLAHKETSIPFDYEVGPKEDTLPITEVPVRGTITPSERQIFERIFADIQARGLQPAVKDDGSIPPGASASRAARLIMQEAAIDAGQARRATVTAPAILSGAAKDRAKALLRFPPQLRGAAAKAMEAITEQALKVKSHDDAAYTADAAAAAEADFIDDDWHAPAHTFGRAVELEARRFGERTRIEGLITSASSDFELWDILEKEVFTMPARLGIVRDLKPKKPKHPEGRKRGRPRAAKPLDEAAIGDVEPSAIDNAEPTPMNDVEASAIDDAEPPAINNEEPVAIDHAESAAIHDAEPVAIHDAEPVAINDAEPGLEASEVDTTSASPDPDSSPDDLHELSLYVHGPLYPAYLLLALRRLDTAFHTPSSLVFSLLPRIKELGLESYVLGVSTPFFNELLSIYWTRRGDLSGMLALLEEMQHCGLYFDNRTAAILNQVAAGVSSMANGTSGLGRALMEMPEFEKVQRERIRHWHRIVDISAQERQNDLGFVEDTGV